MGPGPRSPVSSGDPVCDKCHKFRAERTPFVSGHAELADDGKRWGLWGITSGWSDCRGMIVTCRRGKGSRMGPGYGTFEIARPCRIRLRRMKSAGDTAAMLAITPAAPIIQWNADERSAKLRVLIERLASPRAPQRGRRSRQVDSRPRPTAVPADARPAARALAGAFGPPARVRLHPANR